MPSINVTKWTKRNVWRNGAGDLISRPGLRRLAEPGSGRRWVGGFSVQNPWTLETWHYIADVSTAGHDLVVRILDEDFVEWQAIQTGVDVVPRGFSFGIVEGEIVVGSPDMPTLWGYVGGPLIIATKVASDNPGTTALEVPRGIVCSVLNRIVIADGASMFVSDPIAVTGGSPRTFVAQNQNQRPGVIFGIHEGAGGQLVCVTSAGVYTLDPSAFAVQIVGSNGTDWRLVNRLEAHSYDSSANVKGRIYALTKRGYALVDVEGGQETLLDDPCVPLALTRRVASLDWRTARLYAGEDGPIITDDDAAGSSGPLAHFSDESAGIRSWWSCFVEGSSTAWIPRGTLQDPDGAVMVLSEDGVYAIGGNMDGDQALSSEAVTVPRAHLFSRLDADPDDNPTARHIVYATTGLQIQSAVRGSSLTGLVSGTPSESPTQDTRSIICGTTSWGDAGVWHQPTPMATARFDANFNTPDMTMEVSVSGAHERMGPLAVLDLSESAKKRTPTRGAP